MHIIGKELIKTADSINISIKDLDEDGFFIVETRRPLRTEESLMTYNKYKEHIEGLENYCSHKGYKFKCDNIDEFIKQI